VSPLLRLFVCCNCWCCRVHGGAPCFLAALQPGLTRSCCCLSVGACVDRRGLSSNQLTGSLPGGWGGGGSLPQLQQLFLSYNRLSGTVPSSLRNLGSLQDL
jgi:hypothetical protein